MFKTNEAILTHNGIDYDFSQMELFIDCRYYMQDDCSLPASMSMKFKNTNHTIQIEGWLGMIYFPESDSVIVKPDENVEYLEPFKKHFRKHYKGWRTAKVNYNRLNSEQLHMGPPETFNAIDNKTITTFLKQFCYDFLK